MAGLSITRGAAEIFDIPVKEANGTTAKDLAVITKAWLTVKAVTRPELLEAADVAVEWEGGVLTDVEEGIDPTDGILRFLAVPADTDSVAAFTGLAQVWVTDGSATGRWPVGGLIPFAVKARVKATGWT
jgi:hypothetical protein